MAVLDFGYLLLWVAAAVLGVIFILSLVGIAGKDRRFVVGARVGFYALFILLLGVSATLVHGFVDGVYNNTYIFDHSENELPLGFKLAGLWAGLEGSLIFWTFVLSGMAAIAAFQHRWSSRHPAGRRLEPYTYLVLAAVIGFFVGLSIQQNAFETLSMEHAVAYARHHQIGLGTDGQLLDGRGLNPQLCNYWFVIHPPCLYFGLITFTIPFAFGLAALISGELGDYWVRIARRWAMVSWMFLTSGIILGGLWAYQQLGWGGYWAWDPVENASFLPWCTATAFLHSIMIQERRDMLKWWNAFLMIFTFYLTIEATYMTRSGEISGSVHTFAENASLGSIFRYFKYAIVAVGGFLLFYRFRELKGGQKLESLFSREAAFFVNNLVLVAMCLAVWFLSWMPTNSHAYAGRAADVDLRTYNKVMTPLFCLLLFLTALGPSVGWVHTSLRSLRKNFMMPVVTALTILLGLYAYLVGTGQITDWSKVFIPKGWHAEGADTEDLFYAEGLYPTGLLIFLGSLIICTVVFEFLRAVKGRVRVRKEALLAASLSVFTRDNRRYGGYIVHVGLAVMAIGITASSMFRTYEKFFVTIGDTVEVGPYYVTVTGSNRSTAEYRRDVDDLMSGRRDLEEIQPGFAYLLDEITVRVAARPSGPVANAQEADGHAHDHGVESESDPALSEAAAKAPVVTQLKPELRYFPKQKNWTPEVSIDRQLLGDIYVTYRERKGDQVFIEVFLNPLMWLVWIGWITMVVGGLYAMLPGTRGRVGLSE